MPGPGPVATGMLATVMDRSPAIPRSADRWEPSTGQADTCAPGADQAQSLSVIRAQPSAAARSPTLGGRGLRRGAGAGIQIAGYGVPIRSVLAPGGAALTDSRAGRRDWLARWA